MKKQTNKQKNTGIAISLFSTDACALTLDTNTAAKSLYLWRWIKAGDMGQGETTVSRSPRQVCECLPGGKALPNTITGSGSGEALGGCRCDC